VPAPEWSLAERVVSAYADVEGLRMAVVTGSLARGLADEASDVDVYLYASGPAVTSPPIDRARVLGGDRIVAIPTGHGWFEKYRLGRHLVDIETIDAEVLTAAAEAFDRGAIPSDAAVKLAAGLRDARAVLGSRELAVWQARLAYTDALALAEVKARGPRLLSAQALYELTLARGDVLSFTTRLSAVLLDAIALLGAANRQFVPVGEPKWLPWHLSRLPEVPRGVLATIGRALLEPSPEAMADVDHLLAEILDLVDELVPGADTGTARFVLALRPTVIGP
jgi:predicted nucleotidyltransferase